MSRTTTLLRAVTLGLLLGATACSDEELFRPSSLIPVNALFTRYVAMGNSITAGFQSAGINDSTQRQAYPVLLARQMQTQFIQPLMNKPGCPPPLVNVFTGAVVGGPTAPPCALRETQSVTPPFLNDVAVPGAKVIDALSNLAPTSDANALTTFFLGGQTQLQAMQRANPSFVTIWIGNNDVLGAATDPVNAGNPALVTRVDTFTTRYTAMLNSVDSTATKGQGVLIGVADVGLIPYLTYGQVYLAVKAIPGALPPNFAVSPDCAPTRFGGVGDTALVPFRYGFGLIAAAQANPSTAYTLDCLDDHNIEPAELANLHSAVAGYNAAIASLAAARGYAYVDPNPALLALKGDTAQVAPFPHANPADPKFTTAPFGSAFSKDGVHPSAASHKLIANLLIQAINAKYGTTILAIP